MYYKSGYGHGSSTHGLVKPQNALKKAQELADIERYGEALDVLYEVLKVRKTRTQYQKDIHEPIIRLYLKLCCTLKKSQQAKEGLYQYKALCQNVNIKSLDEVVREYLKIAVDKTEEAKERSQQQVLDVDDLEYINSPEAVLLGAVSSEDSQDRTDRMVLTPWVRFLWESYRHCLDIFRNHNKLERLYHDIAKDAFKFCYKYQRKTEFRKLCENIRNHLVQIQKYQNVTAAVQLSNEETLPMHIETRLTQLDTAIQMDLWLEAFKAIDEIHNLIGYGKKPQTPKVMVEYYRKFALVCLKSNNLLYHAAALHKVFLMTKEYKKSVTEEELRRYSDLVLLATLVVPIEYQESTLTQYLDMLAAHMENQRRLSSVLHLSCPPTRAMLIKELEKHNVISSARPELQTLFYALEKKFDPLFLSEKVSSIINVLESDPEYKLTPYISFLRNVTCMRLLKQVSDVYQIISMPRLMALVPFLTRHEVEMICIKASKSGEIQLRIDHRRNCVLFGTDLTMSREDRAVCDSAYQLNPSQQLRMQLVHVANTLDAVVGKIFPAKVERTKEEMRMQCIQTYLALHKKEHARVVDRPDKIERRLEEIENLYKLKEEEKQRELQLREQQLKKEESDRLSREAQLREEQRKKDEIKKYEKLRLKEQLEGLKKGTNILQDINDEDLEEMNPADLLLRKRDELLKEQKEKQERLKKDEKKLDHFERAMREVEIPLIKSFIEKTFEERRIYWDKMEKDRVEKLHEKKQKANNQRERLALLTDERDLFLKQVQQQRQEAHKENLKEFEQRLQQIKSERLLERKKQRKEDRRVQWLRQRQLEQEKLKEEEKRRIEEARRLEEEKREKERYEEKLMKERERESKRFEDDLGKRDVFRPSYRSNDDFRRNRDYDDRRPEEEDLRRGPFRGDEFRRPAYRDDDVRRPPPRDDEFRRSNYKDDDFRRDDGFRRGPPRDDVFRRGSQREDEVRRRSNRDYDDRRADDEDFRRGPFRGDEFRRGLPREGDFRRSAPREDDFRRGGRDDDFRRGPPRDDDFRRGPPRDDDFRRGPPRDDDFRRGPPREDDYMRAPPRDDEFRRAPPREDFRKAPSRDDDFRRGPTRDDFRRRRDDDFRGAPSRDDNQSGRNDEFFRRGQTDGYKNRDDRDDFRRGSDISKKTDSYRSNQKIDASSRDNDIVDDGWTRVRKK